MAITSVFDISQRALLNNRSAIDTTAKNIANMNVDGYKRREVTTMNLIGFGAAGGGSNTESMTRVRNVFVENQLRREQENLGKYETNEMILGNVESIFGEPQDSGLQNMMAEFWNAWNDLANDPESQAAKVVVKDKAVMLSNTFNRVHSDLRSLQQQIGMDINEKVKSVNQLVEQIYNVTGQLNTNETGDLLDQRDALIDELSKLVNINVREYAGGGINISIGGQILMANDYRSTLIAEASYDAGFSNYHFRLDNSRSDIQIDSGTLGGAIEMNNGKIPNYVKQLNEIASTLSNRVNRVHSLGYNSAGQTGLNFFDLNVSGAADIAVNRDIVNDSSRIATAGVAGASGDGSIALAIYDIQSENLMNNTSLFEAYNGLISQIGSHVRESSFLAESQGKIVANLENQRDAISGVSLDEEMANLIEYEKAYQAAAKLVQTADSMIETLLSIM